MLPVFFRRLRARFTLPPWLVLLLALIAALNLTKVGHRPLGPDRPVDFRPGYVGQWVLRHGGNPYDDQQIRRGWQQLVAAEQLPSHTSPGLPDQGFIYPPWAASFLGLLLGAMPYGLAWPLWYGLLLGCLLLSCRWLVALLPRLGGPAVTLPDVLLTALALKGTVAALLTGQPTFLALALALGALRVAERRPALAGLLLGLASFKITVVLPFGAWFLWRRRWGSLGVAAAVGLGLLATFWHWSPDPAATLATYQQLIANVRAAVVSPADPDYPLAYAMVSQFELANLLEFLHRGAARWALLAYAALVLLVGARLVWLGRRRGPLPDLYLLLVATLLTLLTTYHLFYDALLLLPLLAYGRTLPRAGRGLLLLFSAPHFLPINAVLDALGRPPALQFLYFLLPLSALALLGLLLSFGMRQPESAGRLSPRR